MKYRRLGKTGLTVSEICLGTMTFGSMADEETSRVMMNKAFDAGVDFFDVAEIYPVPPMLEYAGKSEEIVGRFLQGFPREQLLTQESEAAWRTWLKSANYKPVANSEVKTYGAGPGGKPGGAANHDTIGMLAIDARGNLSGACTTSGAAWKMHGRVGDSPIIGAGLYVDNEVGGATSTGMGEEVIRNVGSFLVVELMRGGMSPQAACKAAVERILKRKPEAKMLQVGFLAINKKGEVGAWAIQKGFSYSLCDQTSQDRIVPGQAFFEATPGN